MPHLHQDIVVLFSVDLFPLVCALDRGRLTLIRSLRGSQMTSGFKPHMSGICLITRTRTCKELCPCNHQLLSRNLCETWFKQNRLLDLLKGQ